MRSSYWLSFALAVSIAVPSVSGPAVASHDEKAAVRACKKELGLKHRKRPTTATLLYDCVNKKLGR